MKRLNIFLFALMTSVALWGCSDTLNVEPQASISDDVALSTPDNVKNALVGAYSALGGANAYGGSYIYLTEIYAAPVNEIFFNGTFLQPREVNTKQILISNSFVTGYWGSSYNIINRANNILSALDVFGSDTATRNRVEAEAKFLRGVAYFNLVMVFGKAYNDGSPTSNPGVPIILTPTRTADETLQVPRSTVAQVYAQVLEDLNAAKAALPGYNDFYANTYVASGMLARVHLVMGNYAQAATEANRVINSGAYELFSSIKSNYVRTSDGDETIFAIQNTATVFSNDMAVFHAPLPYGRADIQVLNPHLANYEMGDVRGTLFVATGRGRMSTKYASDNPTVDPRRTNITVMRLAEMHLIRAEANVRTGGSVGASALTDVNAIRERVGLAPLASVNLAAVLKERRNELMFEGFLFSDMKRLQINTQGVSGAINWNSDAMVFPIPEREMLVNKQLTQNPGY